MPNTGEPVLDAIAVVGLLLTGIALWAFALRDAPK